MIYYSQKLKGQISLLIYQELFNRQIKLQIIILLEKEI